MKSGKTFETRKPTVIIPYDGPRYDGRCNDVVLYLRPETNGVMVESILFRVIKNKALYRKNIKICYLANLPGDFIIRNRIIERHYSVRIYFAVNGKGAFTPFMKKRFEEFFGQSFREAKIVGAFEALKVLNIGYDELFNLWVPRESILTIDGQIIKRYRDLYIVNYDIPAILHKNNNRTDIAVMIFRSTLGSEIFRKMINEMAFEFIEEKILNPEKPLSRIFHYSKGPFEQVLDGMGYIYKPDSEHIPYREISFYRYLLERGLSEKLIEGIISHPIVQVKSKDNRKVEDSIFTYTAWMDYQEAYSVLDRIIAQPLPITPL